MRRCTPTRFATVFHAVVLMLAFTVSVHASSLPNGGSVSGVIAVAAQQDSYTFDATAGDSIIFSVGRTSPSGPFNPLGSIYAPDGLRIIANSVHSKFNAPSSGTYTVVVFDGTRSHEETGSYELHFVRAPGANEHGELVSGASYSGQIDIRDLDSYTFYANAGDGIVLSLGRTSTDGSFSPEGYILGPGGQYIANLNHYRFNARWSGTYTVVVFDGTRSHEETGSYELHFVRAPGASEHGALINGGSRSGQIDIRDLDSYTFYANAGDGIVLSLGRTSTDGSFSPEGYIFGPGGQYIVTLKNQYRLTAQSSGTYTVVVFDGTLLHRGTGSYSIALAIGTDRFSYAALGDSYSSGEGLYPYLTPNDAYLTFPFPLGLLGFDGGCHRSNRAYSYQIRRSGEPVPLVGQPDVQFDFFACTGAETINVRLGGKEWHGEPPQLVAENAIDENRDLITVTIGGNDAQWTKIITYCLAHNDCDQVEPFAPHTDITLGELATPILIGYASVGISAVHQEIRDLAPNAAIVVLGYPFLVSGIECTALALPGVPEAKLSSSEQVFLRKANSDLNSVIAASAANVGLHYIPVADAFSEHETCDPGENWVNGLTPLNPAASFHPTVRGQREYARLFNEHMQNLSSGWSPGYLPNGLPRNPEPVPALVAQPQVEALAVEAELPRFGVLGVRPLAVPDDCRSAQGVVVPGEAARVRGEGFDPGETVELSLMVSNERTSLGDTNADSEGSIAAEVNIPEKLAVGTSGTVEALGAGQNGAGLLLLTIALVEASAVADNDGDGLADICDNCSATSNADQRDTDRDGYGNMCDADLDNNGIVNTLDLAIFKASFGASDHALDADLDGNFVVNTLDLAIFKSLFGKAPGPAFKTP